MTNIPKWAENLTIDACEYLQGKGYNFNHTITYNWRKSKTNKLSSGTCYLDHIAITQGKLLKDTKMVLLHELSHWVNPKQHHNENFWLTAWDLYRHFKIPIRHCLKREKNYRKGALVAYRKSK
jgi:hypothetical protein